MNNSFMEIRLMAAIAVIYGHAFVLNGSGAPTILGLPVHALAVKVFFVVSGYLITRSLFSDPDPLRYFARRALRIYPAWFACICLMIFLGLLITELSASSYLESAGTWRYLRNLGFYMTFKLPGVFVDNKFPSINGSLWSIPVEIFAYASIAVLAYLCRLRKLPLVFVLIAIFGVMSWYILNTMSTPNHATFWGSSLVFSARALVYFVVGAIVFLLRLERFLNLGLAIFLCVAFALIAKGDFKEIAKVILVSYITLSVALNPQPVKLPQHFERNDYSYGLYLYAFPIQQLLVSNLGHLHALLQFFLALLLTGAVAWMSWHMIERPFLRLKPGRQG
jgi:peptidoglycan/LPS O-acetylase OafA/YrhL